MAMLKSNHFILLVTTVTATYIFLRVRTKKLTFKGNGIPCEKAKAKPFELSATESEKLVLNGNRNLTKTVRVVYGTTTGNSKECAEWIAEKFRTLSLVENPSEDLDVVDLATYDQDNLEQEDVIVFIVSTWTGGIPPAGCRIFFEWLDDMTKDFRVDKQLFLSGVKVAVIGLGILDYGDNEYCLAARELDTMLASLGATRIAPCLCLDSAEDIKQQVLSLADSVSAFFQTPNVVSSKLTSIPYVSGEQVQEHTDYVEPEEDFPENNSIGDLEDLVVEDTTEAPDEKKEMVTPMLGRALTKQGYKIIGSHSAVKLCRWTKNHLRGRGGCYKNTFYGIKSYTCCEATPSLACASKCVFCWRHSTNPVGTSFKWKLDDPSYIVDQAIKEHCKMIKSLRGVPGVEPDRFKDAFTVRHCALSLVGEPIMYPRINELIGELHARDISTFLVTNAVFPEAMAALVPVTQLYVSVDAATKDALKAVDRPLHKDFWERFMTCLAILKKKRQRTVFRLTLVKEWNMQEVDDYVKLLAIGEPDLVEIKGVTFCGTSDTSNLTMANVPFHADVRNFALTIAEKSNGRYGPACEHAHSCCTLLARKDIFWKNGTWHTWIDYDKFQELNNEYHSSGAEFTTKDYLAPTPSWAIWNAQEAGFNPTEKRFKRTKVAKNNARPPAGLPNQ